MKEIIILQDERIIDYLNSAGYEERGGSCAYVRLNMLIDFKNKWWWQTNSRITTQNEEIETIIKGQQHWKNMPILETKGGRIDSETLKELIDLIVSDVWNNAKHYYINNKPIHEKSL